MNAKIEATSRGTKVGGRFLGPGQYVPQAAARMARTLSDRELEDNTSLLSLYRERSGAAQVLQRALPLETDLKTTLSRRLQKVDQAIAWLTYTPVFNLPIIDPSFLSWKTTGGLPAFSIFKLDSDHMEIDFTLGPGDWLSSIVENMPRNMRDGDLTRPRAHTRKLELSMVPQIPDEMARWYLDAALRHNLAVRCSVKNLQKIALEARYGGVMPEEVREKIYSYLDRPANEPRFDDIYIVAEAPDESWKISGIPRKDPLVIGVSKETHGLLWLIAAYDLTPVEEFAKKLCTDSSAKACN